MRHAPMRCLARGAAAPTRRPRRGAAPGHAISYVAMSGSGPKLRRSVPRRESGQWRERRAGRGSCRAVRGARVVRAGRRSRCGVRVSMCASVFARICYSHQKHTSPVSLRSALASAVGVALAASGPVTVRSKTSQLTLASDRRAQCFPASQLERAFNGQAHTHTHTHTMPHRSEATQDLPQCATVPSLLARSCLSAAGNRPGFRPAA